MGSAAKIKWEHAHQCPKCGFILKADEIDLKSLATGVITCPSCETSGPINVKVLSKKNLARSN